MLSWLGSDSEADYYHKCRMHFQEIWKQIATHRALWIFHQLNLAEIIGDSTISVDELCEKSKCCNIQALVSLLMVLNESEIVVTTTDDDNTMMIRLHENGIMLRKAFMHDVNMSLLVSCMGHPDVDKTWQNLLAVLTKRDPPMLKATSSMYDMVNADFMNSYWKELHQVFLYEEELLQEKKIGIWGVDKHIHLLKELLPKSSIVHVDEDTVEQEHEFDVLVLHRVLGVFYDDKFIRKCLSVIKEEGRLFVVDAIPHESNCVNDLYTHASMFGQNFSVEQLTDLFSTTFDIHYVMMLDPGTVSMSMQKLSVV